MTYQIKKITEITLDANVELAQTVYNKPTASQLATIRLEGRDLRHFYKRSTIIYNKSKRAHTVEAYYGCYDPLSYPLFFPNAESGWDHYVVRPGWIAYYYQNNETEESMLKA